MVATRVALILGFLILYLSIGASWLYVGQDYYITSSLASMVASYVGGSVPPPDPNTPYFSTYVAEVISPLVVGNVELVATMFLYPASLLLGVLAFARWRLSLPAGVAAALSGASWIAGVPAVASQAGLRLGEWAGYGGAPTVVPVGDSLAPYITIIGGLAMFTIFLLTRVGKLDPPFG